jgi:hypothetical protein
LIVGRVIILLRPKRENDSRGGCLIKNFNLIGLSLSVAVLSVALGLRLARPDPIIALDQNQPRFDQAAPVPQGDVTLTQTFVAAHAGLSAIELLAVVYPQASPQAKLTLSLLDANHIVIATTDFQGLEHNKPLRLDFSPLPNSGGQTYRLQLEGSPDNTSTVWAYGLNGYEHGNLSLGRTLIPGDIRFSTSYTYLLKDVLHDSAVHWGRLIKFAVPVWLILFAPGLLVLELLNHFHHFQLSRWVYLGVALSLSLAVLPLAWLWITQLGLSASAVPFRAAYLVIGAIVVSRYLFGWLRRRRWARPSIHDLIMTLILVLSLTTCLLAARDLAFPAWVDSPHHFIIARLLAETGRVPANYWPLLPVDQFIYHFGFHALAVSFQWLTSLTLVESFLFLGQILNGLAPLAVYTFVTGMTTRPRAGLSAAFFVGLVSFFPGYYLSWGRYTQLTGLLIFAPAMAMFWKMAVSNVEHSLARRLGEIILVALLSAGLLLTHYRLFIFYLIFALVALVAGNKPGRQHVIWATVFSVGLTFPWLLRLSLQALWPALASSPGLAAPAGYNDFPINYFQSNVEKGWLVIALLAAGWGLLRRDQSVTLTVGWVAATFAFLNIGAGTWVTNNNSWAITLFIPGALALGWGTDQWLDATGRLLISLDGKWFQRALGLMMLAGLMGLMAYAGAQGVRLHISLANPATTLATSEDAAALTWIQQHTSEDSRFLINGWNWQHNMWAGPDGGSWIWPLVGRQTTLPPVDYTFQKDWALDIRAFNESVGQISDWDAPETLARLRTAGVTHIFIGAKGGTLKPEVFAESPNYRLLYTNGAAWVFELK